MWESCPCCFTEWALSLEMGYESSVGSLTSFSFSSIEFRVMVGYILDRPVVYHRINRETQSLSFIFTPVASLESPDGLTGMSLDCGGSCSTWRTFTLHTERCQVVDLNPGPPRCGSEVLPLILTTYYFHLCKQETAVACSLLAHS